MKAAVITLEHSTTISFVTEILVMNHQTSIASNMTVVNAVAQCTG